MTVLCQSWQIVNALMSLAVSSPNAHLFTYDYLFVLTSSGDTSGKCRKEAIIMQHECLVETSWYLLLYKIEKLGNAL